MFEPWPNVEVAYVEILADALGVDVSTDIPGNVEELDGFIKVTRGPGSDDRITDAPLVDIDTFAVDYGRAWELAEQARQVMLDSTNRSGTLIDAVTTEAAPRRSYYGRNVERVIATYSVSLRRSRI